MTQTVAALIAAAVDYERTLVLAIEVSNESWVLAAQVPGLPHTKAKRTINPDAESLMAAIAGYRARATASGHSMERVITVYEAGWSGFWLARWIMRHGMEAYVIQPSSVPVDRRMRRAKSEVARAGPADNDDAGPYTAAATVSNSSRTANSNWSIV